MPSAAQAPRVVRQDWSGCTQRPAQTSFICDEFMNTSMLQLPPVELNQQVDVSMRLLRMALYGVPKNPLNASEDPEIMALHALMTAFMALAKTSGATSHEALNLLMDGNAELSKECARREGLGNEPLIKVYLS